MDSEDKMARYTIIQMEKVRVGLGDGGKRHECSPNDRTLLVPPTALGALGTPSHTFSIDGTSGSPIAPRLLRNQDAIADGTRKQYPSRSTLYSVWSSFSQSCYTPEFVKLIDSPATTAEQRDACHGQRSP